MSYQIGKLDLPENMTLDEKLQWAKDALKANKDGGFYNSFVNMDAVSISEDDVPKMSFTFDVKKAHQNIYDILHGGIIASLLDEAMGIQATLYARQRTSTASFSVDFLKAAPGKDFVVVSQIDHVGGRLVNASSMLYDTKRNVLCARSTGIFCILTAK